MSVPAGAGVTFSIIGSLLSGVLLFATSALEAQAPDTAALARELPGLMEVGDVPELSFAVLDRGEVTWTGAARGWWTALTT